MPKCPAAYLIEDFSVYRIHRRQAVPALMPRG